MALVVFGPAPWSLWIATVTVYWLITQVRAFDSLTPRILLTAFWGSGFFLSWLISSAAGPLGPSAQRLYEISSDILRSIFVASCCGIAYLLLSSSRWIASVLWFVGASILGFTVAYFSGNKGGPDPMVAALQHLFGLPPETALELVVYVRKFIHLGFYGFVAVAFAQVCFHSGSATKSALRCGFVYAAALAAFDELRQSSSAARTGSILDVLLDIVGATFFLWLVSRTKRSPSEA